VLVEEEPKPVEDLSTGILDPNVYHRTEASVAREIVHKEGCAFATDNDVLKIWDTQSLSWVPCEIHLQAKICEWYKDFATTHKTEEIIKLIKIQTNISETLVKSYPVPIVDAEGKVSSTSVDNIYAKPLPSNRMVLQNGIYNIESHQLEALSPEYYFNSKYQANLNKDAKGPTVDKFLSDIQPKKEDQDFLLEIAGYCLYHAYPMPFIGILLGGGRNGKTTYTNLLRALVGDQNVAAVDLQDFEKDQYSRQDLYGRAFNIGGDIPNVKMLRTGFLKKASGGDKVRAPRKYMTALEFDNTCKFLFSCNEMPKIKDVSDAWFTRIHIRAFPSTFIGANADLEILDKMKQPEELSHFLNLALEGLDRLLKNKWFTGQLNSEENQQLIMKQTDPVYSFIDDKVVADISEKGLIKKSDLYKASQDYCLEKKLLQIGPEQFSKQLLKIKPQIGWEHKREAPGKRAWYWTGIRLKTVNELEQEAKEKSDIILEETGTGGTGGTQDTLPETGREKPNTIVPIPPLPPLPSNDCSKEEVSKNV
jgi:P4 family phage/plasmid primase-like protien